MGWSWGNISVGCSLSASAPNPLPNPPPQVPEGRELFPAPPTHTPTALWEEARQVHMLPPRGKVWSFMCCSSISLPVAPLAVVPISSSSLSSIGLWCSIVSAKLILYNPFNQHIGSPKWHLSLLQKQSLEWFLFSWFNSSWNKPWVQSSEVGTHVLEKESPTGQEEGKMVW